jgi:hypothetical protein
MDTKEATETTETKETKETKETNDKHTVYSRKILDSRCRRSTNLLSFYMTELNGINILIKLAIIGLYIRKHKKTPMITTMVIILALHTCIHILIVVASLPPLCDSSNFNWMPGKYANWERCHKKSVLYYSTTFWLIDQVFPGIIAIALLRT